MTSKRVKEALAAYDEFTDDQFSRYVNRALDLTLKERQELQAELKDKYPHIYGSIASMPDNEFMLLHEWNLKVQKALEFQRVDPEGSKKKLRSLGFSNNNINLMIGQWLK